MSFVYKLLSLKKMIDKAHQVKHMAAGRADWPTLSFWLKTDANGNSFPIERQRDIIT